MERILRRLMDREDGLAMVTAVIVTFVIVAFSAVLVQLSLHNSESSAVDRGRVAAVNAAEAGINVVYSQMERYGFASLPCTQDADLTTTPVEHFHVVVSYYNTYPPSGSPLTCPLSADPAGAVITSSGTTPGANGAVVVTRTMQSEVRLSTIANGASFLGAMYGQTSVSMSNSVTVNGNVGNDANVYSGGAWTCTNTATIQGSVYAASVNASGACTVNQDVWANGSVTSSKMVVGHDLTSSTSSINLTGSAHVTHNATSGTSCSGCSTRVSGTITTNHISPAPPLPTFPTITYNIADWSAAGYQIKTYSDCSLAQSFIENIPDAQKYLVRITPACNLSIGNKAQINFQNDLAIVTNGDINITNQVAFNSSDGAVHTIDFIVPSSGGCGNINFNNQTTWTNVRIFMFTPCNVNWTNKTSAVGQVFAGGNLNTTNQFGLAYYPIYVPGYSSVPGFNVDIAYVREVTS
jgi:hypothetical protein